MTATEQLAAPAVLSTEELFVGVRSLAAKTAVFDCDGTLWSGDAGSSFMWWTMENGLLSREACDWMTTRYAAYNRGEVSELAICGEMVQVYEGLSERELRQAAAEFFRTKIEANIFAEMRQLVAELQESGTQIWAVSSTCDWVIEEGVQRFGIAPERVLAARVECMGGQASSKLLDVPTDEGKVHSLQRAGVTAPDAVFGNSIHDAAMLKIARGAFPINPSPGLIQRSAEEGWAVYYPATTAPAR